MLILKVTQNIHYTSKILGFITSDVTVRIVTIILYRVKGMFRSVNLRHVAEVYVHTPIRTMS